MLTEEGGLERLQELVDSKQTRNDVRGLAQNVLEIVKLESNMTDT